jgi:hypothetical protein
MIYLLTASGLPPGGGCTIHIYTQTIHRTTQNKQYIEQHKILSFRTDFMKFEVSVLFDNLSRKFTFHENLTRIKGTLHDDRYMYIYDISLSSSWHEKCSRHTFLIVVFPCMLIITQLLFQQNALVY